MLLRGEVFRQQKDRITQRIMLGNQAYFLKRHHGVGWREIIKNLLQLRLPVLGAKNEWLALQALEKLEILAPKVVGFGERGNNPATKESFILMQELTSIISLEDLCRDWRTHPPTVNFKRHLINEVARIARELHQHGINHRDFYLCHFLLNTTNKQLYLLDLHRAQIRKKIPERWIIKDLSGLYFSSKDIGLTQRDCYRFMQIYRQQSLRDIVKMERNFWQQVKNRGEQLYRAHHN